MATVRTKKTVAVVGARGYAGLELTRLLLKHPSVELTHAFATRPFQLSDEIFDPTGKLEAVSCLTDEVMFDHKTDIVFLATPNEVSSKLGKELLEKTESTVIDLSGAFRFSPETAEYGLAPYCGPWKPGARLIANPGCYATAINLALIPLLKHCLIETNNIVIDAKSGTTGAGRKADENQLFAEVDGECRPYRVGQHQHLPEIQQAVRNFANARIDPHMVTHLLPTKRGISAAIFATLKDSTNEVEAIEQAYADEYQHYGLVRFGSNLTQFTRLSNVVGSPYTHVSYTLVGNKLYVFSLIDNLLKGAASQAVENMNRFLDLPLNFSLTEVG